MGFFFPPPAVIFLYSFPMAPMRVSLPISTSGKKIKRKKEREKRGERRGTSQPDTATFVRTFHVDPAVVGSTQASKIFRRFHKWFSIMLILISVFGLERFNPYEYTVSHNLRRYGKREIRAFIVQVEPLLNAIMSETNMIVDTQHPKNRPRRDAPLPSFYAHLETLRMSSPTCLSSPRILASLDRSCICSVDTCIIVVVVVVMVVILFHFSNERQLSKKQRYIKLIIHCAGRREKRKAVGADTNQDVGGERLCNII